MTQTVRELNEKIASVEAEKDQVKRIGELEKQRMTLQQSTSDLDKKICQNCIETYSKLE